MNTIKEKTKTQAMGAIIPRQEIPESWKRAAGMLKGRKKRIDPVKYQREIRKESETRLKRQFALAKKHGH
jgi:hypothetical protein